ncbi:hypothetical protein CASFOL_036898 [Castilleja foliolosa]|uniref:GPI transamidase subunit PIG-U n=1 Tax=Castilleja foliolosa TaxID=1961234 RepID=A0ABD3BPD4_9LAMI
MADKNKIDSKIKKLGFWNWAIASIIFRLILSYFSENLNLSTRPEVSTPITSLRRLAEGYWLKQLSMSPYSGSMYHGSPLLLSALGPLTVKKIYGQPSHLLCSYFISAILIRATGQNLLTAHGHNLKSLGLDKLLTDIETDNLLHSKLETLPSGDIAALVYLWNPFTIVSSIGFNTAPIENLFVIISLYGASVVVIFLLGYGLDAPPRKLFAQTIPIKTTFSWRRVSLFVMWASIWISYVLVLCAISMREYGGLGEMFKRTYGFILSVEDLSPNIGVLWYFFAEVFDFFRNFFLIVFHVNILFMILPLAMRLNHRPCFLVFVYLAISSMLKSYPSVGDSALYLSLLGLFVNELAEMQFSFFLFCGYVGVSLLSPVMHNLWIWRGTGNANFYFATAMAYACFQIILAVESVSAMLNHDRKIIKLCNTAKA